MSEPKRINLRVNADLYDRLDDKRHAERTTFQAIGIELFRQWLSGEDRGEDVDNVKAGTAEIKVLADAVPDGVKQFLLGSGFSRLSPDDMSVISTVTEMLAAGENEPLISTLRHMSHAYKISQENRHHKRQEEAARNRKPVGAGRKAS